MGSDSARRIPRWAQTLLKLDLQKSHPREWVDCSSATYITSGTNARASFHLSGSPRE